MFIKRVLIYRASLIAAVLSVSIASIGLQGCSQSKATTSPPSSTTTSSPAIDPAIYISSADDSFRKHSWDEAIAGYQVALTINLPQGPATQVGTKKYAQHQLSLSHMYKGLEEKQNGSWDVSADEFTAAVNVDPTNIAAAKMLHEVQREEDISDAQYEKSSDFNVAAKSRSEVGVDVMDQYQDTILDATTQGAQVADATTDYQGAEKGDMTDSDYVNNVLEPKKQAALALCSQVIQNMQRDQEIARNLYPHLTADERLEEGGLTPQSISNDIDTAHANEDIINGKL